MAPGLAKPLTAATQPLDDSKIATTPCSLKNKFLSIEETKSGFLGGLGGLGSLGNGFCDNSNNSVSVYLGVPVLNQSKSILGGGVAKTALPLSLPLYFSRSFFVFISTNSTESCLRPSKPGVCAIG